MLFVAAAALLTAFAAEPEVSVVSTSPDGITLRVSTPAPELTVSEAAVHAATRRPETMKMRARRATRVPGALTPSGFLAPSHEGILEADSCPWRVWVGIPPGVGVGLEFRGRATLSSCSGVPVVGTRSRGEPVRIGSVGYVRLQPVVELELMPYRMIAQNAVEYVPEMEVELRFSGNALPSRPLGDDQGWEALYRGLLVNYEEARQWRRRPERGSIRSWLPPPDAAKLLVERQGIYRVTRGELQQAGVDVGSIDPRTFRLLYRGQEVPLHVVGEDDGTFDPGDSLVFWGTFLYRDDPAGREVPWEGLYSATRVYWLTWGGSQGIRYALVNGTPSGTAGTLACFLDRLHAEVDSTFFWGDHGECFEGTSEWYWGLVGTAAPVDFSFRVWDVASSDSAIVVRIGLHGYSPESGHHTLFYMNGNVLNPGGTYWGYGQGRVPLIWDSDDESITVPGTWLQDGENTLTVEELSDGPAGTASRVLMDWLEVAYWRETVAVGESIDVAVPATWAADSVELRLQGFPGPEVEVLEVYGQRKVTNAQWSGGELVFQMQVGDSSRVVAASQAGLLTPSGITAYWQGPALASATNQASCIVITHEDFATAAAQLAAARNQAGVPTMVVGVADVYDQFSFGEFTPVAVRDFLQAAFENWMEPLPRSVLLLGDACWDYRKRSGPAAKDNFVPSYGTFGDENYFVSLTHQAGVYDWMPDMWIGRLPAQTAQEASDLVAKTLAYQAAPYGSWRKTVVMTTCGTGPGEQNDFKDYSDLMAATYLDSAPALCHVIDHHRTFWDYETRLFNEEITATLDSGAVMLHFLGRASELIWGVMYEDTDAQELANGSMLPFVIGNTCHSGRFAEPLSDCISEVFLRRESAQHGAIGFWGSTGATSLGPGYVAGATFMELAFEEGRTGLGDATAEGKLRAGSFMAPRLALLGDPEVALLAPQEPDLVAPQGCLSWSLATVTVGDNVTISATLENWGTWAAPSVSVRFYDGDPTAGGTLIGERPCVVSGAYLGSARVGWQAPSQAGTHQIYVVVDPSGVITESREDNNVAWETLDVYWDAPTALAPLGCGIVSTVSPVLTVSNAPHPGGVATYHFEVARTDTLDPGDPGYQVSGPVAEGATTTSWAPPVPLQQGFTYYWRARLCLDGTSWGAWTVVSSFTVDTAAANGWLQADGPQFAQDTLAGGAVSDTGAVVLLQSIDTTDLADTSLGAAALAVSSYLSGYPPENLLGPADLIFGSNDTDEWAKIRLADTSMVGLLGSTQWVGKTDRPVWSELEIRTSLDDVTYHTWAHLGPFAEPGLNVPSVLLVPSPAGQPQPVYYVLFRFGEGLTQTQGSVVWGSRIHEARAFNLVYPDTGFVLSPPVGPASSWQTLSWGESLPAGTEIEVDVLGWTGGDWSALPGYGSLTDASGEDLSGIDAGQHPYVRLCGRLLTSDPNASPALAWWHVGFALLRRRAGLYSVSVAIPGESVLVLEGEGLTSAVTLRNEGEEGSAALKTEVLLDGSPLGVGIVALAPGQEAEVSYEVPRTTSPGVHAMRALVRHASVVLAESDWTVTVLPDTVPPTARLSVAGGTVVGIVADVGTGPDPEGVRLVGDGEERLVSLSWQADTLITRSSLPPAREVLVMEARDKAGNTCFSTPLAVGSGVAELAHVWCYPNPCAGATEFLFLAREDGFLTPIDPEDSDEAAVDVDVTVHTLAGALVRRLREEQTDGRVPWDCRDEAGDPVANGVYLYRASARDREGRSFSTLGRVVVYR